jgi:hypothetical protein
MRGEEELKGHSAEEEHLHSWTLTHICIRVEELKGHSAEEEHLHSWTLTRICIRVEEELEAERFR